MVSGFLCCILELRREPKTIRNANGKLHRTGQPRQSHAREGEARAGQARAGQGWARLKKLCGEAWDVWGDVGGMWMEKRDLHPFSSSSALHAQLTAHAVDDVRISKRIVAQEGGAKMPVRAGLADPYEHGSRPLAAHTVNHTMNRLNNNKRPERGSSALTLTGLHSQRERVAACGRLGSDDVVVMDACGVWYQVGAGRWGSGGCRAVAAGRAPDCQTASLQPQLPRIQRLAGSQGGENI
ncbi:hypothetical protein EYF80_002205 [Liparis tanakae]|uniref:Uncharacterized protein n=1 Tax=Liparis tanakae TaxID=230148 RepID=A0A4Z2JCY1_9TELE|nr:hypothetical protein EYF80_002205 [Liparis tanakae]